jgi:hypothetical protein
MASGNESNFEHAFIPKDETMTVVFASSAGARRAIFALSEAGIRPDEVELVSGADHRASDGESRELEQDSTGVEAFDEILHVFTESFSDDEKAYALFDRALAAGWALLSLSMAGREERRSELASLLRLHGARAIYYWGTLATERL